jgi:hypothetical protein
VRSQTHLGTLHQLFISQNKVKEVIGKNVTSLIQFSIEGRGIYFKFKSCVGEQTGNAVFKKG